MSMWYTSDNYVRFRSFVRKKIMCRGLLKIKFLTQQVLLKKRHKNVSQSRRQTCQTL